MLPPFYSISAYSDNYEDNEGGSSSGGSSSSYILVLAIVVPLKIALWIICCCCRHKRRQERIDVRRRTILRDEVIRRRARGVAAQLIANDELQREHAHAQPEQLQNGRPPPPYSLQADHHENRVPDTERNTLLSLTNPIEDRNIDPIRGALGTGGTDEMNAEAKGPTMVPPHPCPSVNFQPDTADQNSSQTELIQL